MSNELRIVDGGRQWDSEEWRKLRDEKMMAWLGNRDAVDCVNAISTAAEAWDDIYDGDPADIDSAMVSLLLGLPMNPFWRQFNAWLQPIVLVCINAWMDARVMEKGPQEDKIRAFVLRNLGIELVMSAAFLLYGYEHMRNISMEVRRFFDNEQFAEWEAEHAAPNS